MCGRFALFTPPEKLAEIFQAELHFDFRASYNIAPTLNIPVMILIGDERHIVSMRWGLIPRWHREGQKLSVLNNAKIETIDVKPAFRNAFKKSRCLILADGFYEWDSKTTPKQPYYFYDRAHQPIALGGIWEQWTSEETRVESCCIITEPANTLVEKIHTRMPVIITPDHYDQWMSTTELDTQRALSLASASKNYENMTTHPVTPRMNRVDFNEPACIRKV